MTPDPASGVADGRLRIGHTSYSRILACALRAIEPSLTHGKGTRGHTTRLFLTGSTPRLRLALDAIRT